MAYIHCAKCNWEQDDFYTCPHYSKYSWYKFTLGYNPISRIVDSIGWLWKPRILNIDGWIMGKGYNKTRIFSWFMFIHEMKRIYRSWKNMKWYTMKSLKKDNNSRCPKCNLSGRGWWVCD